MTRDGRTDKMIIVLFKRGAAKGLAVAESLPTLPTAYRVEPLKNDTYRIYINCPHCGYDNRFDYKK